MVQPDALQQNPKKQWLLEYQMLIVDICVLAQQIIMQDVFAVKTDIFYITDALTNAGVIAKLPKKIKVMVRDAGHRTGYSSEQIMALERGL